MRSHLLLVLGACNFSGSPAGGDDAPVTDAANTRDGEVIVDAPPGGIASPRRIRFDNTASASNLDGFPLLVKLTPTRVDYSTIGNPDNGLRFEDSDNTVLPHEIETWVPNGISYVWVRVPRIDAGSTTDSILMHFGEGTGTQDASAVWGGYRVVLHLGPHADNANGSDDHDIDSTTMVTPTAGFIGGAHGFDATFSQMQLENAGALFDGWADFSFEYWIRLNYADTTVGGEPRVLSKNTAAQNGRLIPQSQAFKHQIDWNFAGSNTAFIGPAIAPQTWTYVAWSYDGRTLRSYADGVPVPDTFVADQTRSLDGDSSALVFGSATNNSFLGQLDEIRIRESPVSADWIEAQNKSMRDELATFEAP